MKLYKILRRDLQINSASFCRNNIISFLLFSFLFLKFIFDVFHYFPTELISPWNINALNPSLGDLILVEIGGSLPKYDALGKLRIELPVVCLLVHLIPCGFTLNYLQDDIQHGGIQVFTRLGNLKAWWYSKCVWNAITVIWYYIVGYAAWCLLCAATGKSLALCPNAQIFNAFFSAELTDNYLSTQELFLGFIFLPALVSAALSLCQMALTLFIKPIFAFLISCIFFSFGVYYIHPVFFVNYAMPVRNSILGVYSFGSASGLLCCCAVSAIAVLIGKLRLSKYDIVNEN